MTVEIKAVRKLRDYVLDVDLSVPDGEILVLIGRNGSGKSTILRMVAGLMSPDRGRISVGGRTFFDSSKGIDLPPEERNVGFMFQSYAVFPHLTVYGNLAFGLRNKKVKDEDILGQVQPLMEDYGLWEVRDVKAGKLSGGQKQRVCIARALTMEPALMIADEPTSMLDPSSKANVLCFLKGLQNSRGFSILMVTHDLTCAAKVSDRIYLLKNGRLQPFTPFVNRIECSIYQMEEF